MKNGIGLAFGPRAKLTPLILEYLECSNPFTKLHIYFFTTYPKTIKQYYLPKFS